MRVSDYVVQRGPQDRHMVRCVLADNETAAEFWRVGVDEGLPLEEQDARRDANALRFALSGELADAARDMLDALAMGPLEVAAKYGPDAHPDEPVIDAGHQLRALLARLDGGGHG